MNGDGTFLWPFPVRFEERHARVIQADLESALMRRKHSGPGMIG